VAEQLLASQEELNSMELIMGEDVGRSAMLQSDKLQTREAEIGISVTRVEKAES
jgi:hypothetical protein